jgi:hypothetical protein
MNVAVMRKKNFLVLWSLPHLPHLPHLSLFPALQPLPPPLFSMMYQAIFFDRVTNLFDPIMDLAFAFAINSRLSALFLGDLNGIIIHVYLIVNIINYIKLYTFDLMFNNRNKYLYKTIFIY